MRKFKFGVDTFIWAEDFTEKDLWIVEKAAELGFVLDKKTKKYQEVKEDKE